MSECKHGYYCKDGTPCVLCHEDELADLRASNSRLREALDGLREAYRIMRNAAAGYSQHCEGFTTKLDKDCARAEDIARAALEVKP